MKIAILGAGGTGSCIGYFLQKANDEVWLVDVNAEHMQAVRENGLSVALSNVKAKTTINETIRINATTSAKEAGPCDLVIILTKEPSTRAAVEGSRELFDSGSFVLMMQNGIGNEEALFDYFPEDRIGRGVATVSSTLVAPGVIHGRYGADPLVLRFGSLNGRAPWQLKELLGHMNASGADSELSDDIMKTVWDKALVNLPTSFVTGLVGIPAPGIINTQPGRELMSNILSEAIDVASACGITYDKQKEIDVFLAEYGPHMAKFSSAARDMFNHRITEVEAINGAIGRLGRKYGIPTPVNDTIADLVRTIQLTYAEQDEAQKNA